LSDGLDEALAERIRSLLTRHAEVTERKMFGGIAFMVGDRMAVGIVGDDLMVRAILSLHGRSSKSFT